jgi:hypothetical protein
MNSSELFSHPYEPEVSPSKEDSEERVQAPVFSDRPGKESTRDTPATP